VNGVDIPRTELEEAVRAFENRAGGAVPADKRDEVYRGVLNDIVALRLLREQLKSQPVEVPEAEIEEAMTQLRTRFPNEAAFKQALAAQKMSVQQLREQTRGNLQVNRLLEQAVGGEIAVKPSELVEFYEKNPDRFQEPESFRASHVLIGVPENADAAAKAAARAKAENVLKQARGGADFAKLARTFSDDASKQRGGDLGFMPRGRTVPAFEQAALALQPGGISDVVETQFGFHVIKLIEKRPARTVPFTQVASQIEQFLLEQRKQEKAKAYVDTLKTRGKVEILI